MSHSRACDFFNFTLILTLTLIPLSHSLPVKRDVAVSDTVKELLSALDETVNPCDDFYAYSCGHWSEHHPSVEGYDYWTNMIKMTTELDPKIVNILKAEDSENDTNAIRKARRIYRACSDDDKIEKDGVEPIKSFINGLGGWPLIMNLREWKSKNLNVQQIVNQVLKTMSLDTIFSIDILADPKNSSITRFMIGGTSLVLKEKEILAPASDDLSKAYNDHKLKLIDIFQKASGASSEGLTTTAQLADLNKFEKELAEISSGELGVQDIDRLYNLMTIDELQAFYDRARISTPNARINWLESIRELASLTPEIIIDGSEKVIVLDKDYFPKLAALLDKTPPETIVNYIMWRVINDAALFANDELRSLMQILGNQRIGADNIPDRQSTCASPAPLEAAVSYAFAQKYASPEIKQAVTEMVANMQNAMEKYLRQSSWLDTETKNLATEKIHVMSKLIAYPDYYSPAFIDEYYSEYPASDSFFDNEKTKRGFMMKKKLRSLRKPTDKKTWPAEPTEINAFYVPVANAMLVPSAILKFPVYDPNRPSLFNYAMVGGIIGHEICHSLDSSGRRFNKNGDTVVWWNQDAIDKYQERAQCFINQFNNYVIYDDGKEVIHLNGTLTMGENISDSEGLIIAWDAYQTDRKKKGTSSARIPGLEKFTDDQLFFLAFGNTWCTNQSPEYLKKNGNTDEHSPNKQRVNGPLSNNEVFAAAFNCPANSPMNPMNKCSIWK
ncbi:endothelin-converting enzyme homolog [Diachasma alloeum]|uniref:endothelin-converting enzyme homolog n=1 Tax=Diachasma alloeum TaxID=454923 RepID=UPI0007382832|nr:endothelin-converting enzyme homolog [Diachasma alloeum]